MHVLSKLSASLPATRIADNLNVLTEITQILFMSLQPNIKFFRLGSAGVNISQPLKVIFLFKELAIRFVGDLNSDKWIATDSAISISVSCDHTLLE